MKEIFKCPECEKEYKTQKGLDDHIKNKHSKELSDESDTFIPNEEENVLEEEKIPSMVKLEAIAKRFKMTGGFSGKDIKDIDILYTYFTGIKCEPSDCRNQMIYRCQCVAHNYYQKIKK